MMSGTHANQNAIFRLANLPVLSSAYARVSIFYCDAKDNYPYIKSVCEVVEIGVKTITSAAYDSAAPFVIKLEPQISIVNELACKGLDKLESTMPVLHQPPEQIALSAKGIISEAKAAVTIVVNGAISGVFYTITGVVGRTKGVVQERLELTRWLIEARGIHMVPLRRAIRLASDGLDSALSLSEILVDQALPPTNEEIEEEVKIVKGFEVPTSSPSYSIRVVSLTVKLCRRAYHQAEVKARCFKLHNLESFSLFQHTMETDKPGALAEQTSHVQVKEMEQDVFHSPTHQLQTSCVTLGWNLHILPCHLQQQALCVLLCASQIYNNFSSTQDRSPGRVMASLEVAMDYLVHNTPLSWLVGPLFTRSPPVPLRTKPNGSRTRKRASKRASVFDNGCNAATLYKRY